MPEVSDLKLVSEAQVQAAFQKKNAKQAEPKVETTAPTTNAPSAEIKTGATPELKPETKSEGTTSVAEDGKVIEGEKPKRKSAKEIAKPFSKSNPVITEENEIPEQFKSKFTTLEKELAAERARRAELESDFDLEILREAKKSGKTAFDILRESLGEDISKLTPTQLYERELRLSGVKPAEELEEGSDEPSLEEEMEKFKGMGKLARDKEIAEIKKKYESLNSNKAGEFLNKLKSANQEKDKISNQERDRMVAVANKTKKELNELADSYIGQEHMAVSGTPQLAESIKNFKLDDLIRTNEDGSLNTEDLFDLIHYKLTKNLRNDNLENQIRANAYEEFMSEVNVTGGAKTTSVRTPQSSNLTAKEIREQTLATLKPVSVGHESVRL